MVQQGRQGGFALLVYSLRLEGAYAVIMTDLEKAALAGERQRANEASVKLSEALKRATELRATITEQGRILATYRTHTIELERKLAVLKARGWWARLTRRGE